MSINASHFLKRMYAGSELIYNNQIIAKIIGKNDHAINIKDVHGKNWSISPERLQQTHYNKFIKNLAIAVAKHCPEPTNSSSAQSVLSSMSIGEGLRVDNAGLITLTEIDPETSLGPLLTFTTPNKNLIEIYRKLVPYNLDYDQFLDELGCRLDELSQSGKEPILLGYFKEEFIPKMMAQMDYDQNRWGDSWLFQPLAGQEKSISEHFKEYFDFNEKFGKNVPWLKVAGYAIIAQAREDHPEWLM